MGAGGSWVDVRDLAEAHVLALERESAGGQRIIASAGQWIWQEWGEYQSKSYVWSDAKVSVSQS